MPWSLTVDQIVKQNSTDTATTIVAHAPATGQVNARPVDGASVVVSAARGLVRRGRASAARNSSGGTASSKASRPLNPATVTAPIASGPNSALTLAAALARDRLAAASGPLNKAGVTSTNPAAPNPSSSAPAAAAVAFSAVASSAVPAAATRAETSRTNRGPARSAHRPVAPTTSNPIPNDDDNHASSSGGLSRSADSSTRHAPRLLTVNPSPACAIPT
nr:hypothetical protein [Actinomadura hibisca]